MFAQGRTFHDDMNILYLLCAVEEEHVATAYLKEGTSVTMELNLQSYFILINLNFKSHM